MWQVSLSHMLIRKFEKRKSDKIDVLSLYGCYFDDKDTSSVLYLEIWISKIDLKMIMPPQ